METTSQDRTVTLRVRTQRFLRLIASGTFLLLLLMLLASQASITYFAQSYRSENSALQSHLEELSDVTGGDVAGPEELLLLSHQVSRLDPETTSIGSFLQSMSTTTSTGGWCGNYVRVFVEYARMEGYPAHKIHLRSGSRSHTVAEILYEGKWRVVDPFFGRVFPTAAGELATFEDLVMNPALVGGVKVVQDQDPRLARIYAWYEPIYGALYRNALEFQWSPHPSALFHDAVLVLSYPMDVLVEGPRRPVIPYWLDRPELLGVYLGGGVFLGALILILRRRRHSRV